MGRADFAALAGRERIRHFYSTAACLTIMALTMASLGCAAMHLPEWPWGGGNPEEAKFVVVTTMGKSDYRPGEAIKVAVLVQNVSGRALTARRLDASAVKLAFGQVGDDETPVYQEPVSSPTAKLGGMTRLEPGQWLDNQFVFTRVTHFSGALKGSITYDPNPPSGLPNGVAPYGEVMRINVVGKKLFDRDSAGLITKEDAIRVAKAQEQGRPVQDAKAIVIQDKGTGLYVTWVDLVIDVPQGTELSSWLIDPYEGRALSKAKPFNPAAAEDPRFRRPSGLSPLHSRGDAQAPARAAGSDGASASSQAPRVSAPGGPDAK